MCLVYTSLVPSPTPSFSVLSSDEKLGVGLGTRLGLHHMQPPQLSECWQGDDSPGDDSPGDDSPGDAEIIGEVESAN